MNIPNIGKNYNVNAGDNPDNIGLPKNRWIRMIFVELVASFFFLFTIGMAQMIQVNDMTMGLVTWGAYMFSYAFRFFPGENVAHLNPIISLAKAAGGEDTFSWTLAFFYVVANTAASALAFAIIYGLSPIGSSFGTPFVGFGYTIYQAFGYEIMGTFIFVSIVLWLGLHSYILKVYGSLPLVMMSPENVFTNKKNRYDRLSNDWVTSPNMQMETQAKIKEMAYWRPLVEGVTLAGLTSAGYQVSNGLFHPYRYLWPAIYSGNIDGEGAMIWIAGPFIGALGAVLVYYLFTYWYNYDYRKMNKSSGMNSKIME